MKPLWDRHRKVAYALGAVVVFHAALTRPFAVAFRAWLLLVAWPIATYAIDNYLVGHEHERRRWQ